jgi:hypothetical protein
MSTRYRVRLADITGPWPPPIGAVVRIAWSTPEVPRPTVDGARARVVAVEPIHEPLDPYR